MEKKLSKDERPASEGTITTRVEQKQAAATVYGKYFDGCLAFAAAKRSDYIVADAAFVGRGTECEPGRNVSVCLAIGRSSVFDAHTYQCLAEIGTSRMGAGFGTVRMRSIFAGWLIALMVWLLPGAESARVSIIIILTCLVGISGFNHIIAGSTTMFFLVVTKSISLEHISLRFFPTLLGNVIGGLALVAALGHVQLVGGKEEQGKAKGQQSFCGVIGSSLRGIGSLASFEADLASDCHATRHEIRNADAPSLPPSYACGADAASDQGTTFSYGKS